ncbi:PsiF family protein [Serratia sp. NPDC071084]
MAADAAGGYEDSKQQYCEQQATIQGLTGAEHDKFMKSCTAK